MSFPTHPELSYSKSRVEKYETCPRQYWFNYLGYWNGWSYKSDRRTAKIYFHKNLSTYPQLCGIVVHECIAKTLDYMRANNIRLFPASSSLEYVAEVTEMWNTFVLNTESRKWANVKKTPAIAEVIIFDNPGPYLDVKLWVDKSLKYLQNFIDGAPAWFNARFDEGWVVESVDDKLNGVFNVMIDGKYEKVYAIIDVLLRNGDKFIVLDWKTGDSDIEDSEFQGIIYGLSLIDRYNAEPENITFMVVNLKDGNFEERSYTFEQYETALKKINRDVAILKAVDFDKEECFACTTDVPTCFRCGFKPLCPVGKKYVGPKRDA